MKKVVRTRARVEVLVERVELRVRVYAWRGDVDVDVYSPERAKKE